MYGNTKVKRTSGKWKRNDIIILLLVGICAFLLMEKDVIFAEGNPLVFIKPMFLLATGKEYTEVSIKGTEEGKEIVYLTQRSEKENLFKHIEEAYKVKFTEQNGNAYTFYGSSGKKVLTGRIYLKYYIVWRLHENK
ncbi:hypothetical protein [Anaerocolumna chitinilytica]|uniref:Uncharacterized protein n=1 Tax=Anaerocolumna chitinilytica TaxID=1727145 RepID=A0A7I8DHM6_9FIRM|nr:hypothetical protein [Anaerocolumna chitinilytica]BCJ98008.1 hypothetical protein bsdcttw_10490 [Anaerocolumna chitinilytica]